MPRLKLHFDGWLSLPPRFRQQLDLHAGDELEAELVGETIVLRKAKGSARHEAEEVAAPPVPAPAEPLATQVEEAPPQPKRRGRPRKAEG